LCNFLYYVTCGAPVLRMRGALVSTPIWWWWWWWSWAIYSIADCN